MKKPNIRDIFIFKTADNHFVNITKDMVKDILDTSDFSFFSKLDKEQQLKFLEMKKFSIKELKHKIKTPFISRKIININKRR